MHFGFLHWIKRVKKSINNYKTILNSACDSANRVAGIVVLANSAKHGLL